LAGRLEYFRVDLHRLETAADLTVAITRESYPSLEIPFHSRWRHFAVDGHDRWMALAATEHWPAAAARARAEFDLAIVSVSLDAGAGVDWRYRDAQTGRDMGRSEGLAIGSLAMFADGLFSRHTGDRLRVDAEKLVETTSAALISGFQAGPGNTMIGIDGRAELLRRLGRVVTEARSVFARNDEPRPGGVFDHLANLAPDGQISATTILAEVLKHLGPIWPARIVLGGIPLGDCWRHPAVKTGDATSQLVPFHKLSQWLTYSLIEPMER